MSRAFTKEDDAGEDLPERPVPAGPNYVTARGLELLRQAGRELAERKRTAVAGGGDVKPVERDLRYLEARINGAVLVPPGSGDEIRFGATVTLEEADGGRKTVQIVGDDEAREDTGRFLSWSSPLALAMLGAKPGETVTWEGPEATVTCRIVSVTWPSPA